MTFFWHPVKNMAADIPAASSRGHCFYSSIPLIYRKFAYFLDDIIDGNRFINDELPKKDSGLSPVSISVGVAFTDRKNRADSSSRMLTKLFIW